MTEPTEPPPHQKFPEREGVDQAAPIPGSPPTGSRPFTGQWIPPDLAEIAEMLDGYRITALLGRGGMGAVYRGVQISLEREVAIKILPPELGGDPEFQARFKREAKSMARLNHPSIVQIYDFGETTAGYYYLVMEYVDGSDLHRMIREGLIDVTGALNAVSQICEALQYAHEMGFVHRDIKPANIFINRQGMLKVGDFGLAKLVEGGEEGHQIPADFGELTGTGVTLGTLNYIAPEQLTEGAIVDRRADIYSLGVMFYEMLTRELPRGAVKEPSKRVAMLDIRIDGVVFKAMDPDPSERYQSAAALRTDVDVIRTTPAPLSQPGAEPAGVAHPSSGDSARPRVSQLRRSSGPARRTLPARPRRHSWRLWAAGAGLILLLAAVVLWRKRFQGQGGVAEGSESSAGAITNTLGMKFVPVPDTGVFMCVHETRKKDYAAYAREMPNVNSEWTQTEVEGVPFGGTDEHPVSQISWKEAVAFCDWLSKKEGRTYRLPTDREWSRAAGTADLEPAALVPEALSRLGWGGPPNAVGNFADASWKAAFPRRSGGSNPGNNDGYPTTAPVMSFEPNDLGIFDLKGNVWEFCSDYYNERRETRSLRGNCWNDVGGFWANRAWREEEMRHPTNGFRCVLEGPDYPLPNPVLPAGTPVGKPQRHGLSRYQFIAAKGLPWSEARLKATEMGGHLATLTTPLEIEWAVQTFGSLLDSAGQSLWLGGYGQSANTASDWYWVTSENWSTPDWPLGNAVEDRSKVPMHFAALSRSPEGTATLAVVPPKVPGNAGFLVEWEDSDGEPALTATGPPPAAPFVNSLGMTFLPVPGTDIFLCAHETRKSDFAVYAVDQPGLSNSWQNPPGPIRVPVSTGGDHPVVSISWYEARSFCEWLGRKEGRAYRLPTDREWSIAADIGDLEAAGFPPSSLDRGFQPIAIFPWGVNLDGAGPGAGNFFDLTAKAAIPGRNNGFMSRYQDGYPTTAPVRSFKSNRFGFFDLAGNVWEYCEDRYAPGLEGVPLRGGGWMDPARSITDRINLTNLASRSSSNGFRCALVVNNGAAARQRPALAERVTAIGVPQRQGFSRYQMMRGKVTWGEARVFAESLGGHLAILASAEENDWVKTTFGDRIAAVGDSLWCGAFFHDGKRWLTGERFAYQDWLPGWSDSKVQGGALTNQRAMVLLRAAGGRLGWESQTVDGQAAGSPLGFLVEWEDVEGEPPLREQGTAPETPFTNSLDMKFVPVPGTQVLFCIHETRKRDYAAFAAGRNHLDAGWVSPKLDDVPVSAAEDHPVVMINWHEALAFCDWLSRKEGRTYRLPTDREWSLAAGLGDLENPAESPEDLGRKLTSQQSWGEAWPPPKGVGNFGDESFMGRFSQRPGIEGYDDGFPTSSPVMSFASNPLGLFDLGGNVSEWVMDRFGRVPTGKYLRGSNWFESTLLQDSRRRWDPSGNRRYYHGFRCVLVVGPEATPSVATGKPGEAETPAP